MLVQKNNPLEVQECALNCLLNILVDSEQVGEIILDCLPDILNTLECILSKFQDPDGLLTAADAFRHIVSR